MLFNTRKLLYATILIGSTLITANSSSPLPRECELTDLTPAGQFSAATDSRLSNAINYGTDDIEISKSGSEPAVFPPPTLEPRDDATVYEQAVTKGRALWNVLQSRSSNPTIRDRSYPCNLYQRWDRFSGIEPASVLIKKDWKRILGPHHGVMPEFDEDALVWVTGGFMNPTVESASTFYYMCEYSTEYKTIIATASKGLEVSLDGSINRAPDRWSDVVFFYWKLLCHVKGISTSSLTYLMQDYMINPGTLQIANMIFGRKPGLVADPDGLTRITLLPESDDFMALLKTPNFVGSMYMLGSYPHGLGIKTIKYIHLVRLPPVVGRLSPKLAYHAVIMLEHYVAPVAGAYGTIDTEQ